LIKYLTYLLLTIIAIWALWQQLGYKENFYQWQYDITSRQQIITTQQDINKIIDAFPSIPFSDLDKEYLSHTKYDIKKYQKLAKDSKFLIVKGKDIFKFVVGDFRIKDFLPRDEAYYSNLNSLGTGKEINWLVDRKLLFKLLELQDVLVEKGYDETGFTIVNGFRHPAYNEKVGGAKLSRHLKGQALDIQIGDINNDGYANQKDKTIVLDLLEKIVIKDQGGIGRYPGTMSVHFDVRGYRARWDKQ